MTDHSMDDCDRYLIAAGTFRYDHLPDDQQLPSVEQDIVRIVTSLELRGYRQILPELATNPTANDLRKTLGKWFNDARRKPSDRVIFYYSGHGEVLDGGGHYLCARDVEYGELGLLPSTAYPDEEIATAIAISRVQHALIIFDTCFSSSGIRSFSQRAATILNTGRWDPTLPHGIHLIAAAREREIAKEGIFSAALCDVLENRNLSLGGRTQRYIRPAAVAGAVNAIFENKHLRQLAAYGLATPIWQETAELLPNPQFESGRPVGLELDEHWLPKARGGPIKSSAWYFTGRERALSELVSWLSIPRGDGRARVVTGSPGAGKSAVLARLVTLADAEERMRLDQAGLLKSIRHDVLPPAGSIDLAIHARGKTLADIAALFGQRLVSADLSAEQVIEALEKNDGGFVVVIDALDEAVEPSKIARELLRPIAALPNVKLLCATRPDGGKDGRRVEGLGSTTVEIDLDREIYLGTDDIQTYVERRLLAIDDPISPTPYRKHPFIARTVARAVAEYSGKVFLIARVVSDLLINEAEPRQIDDEASLRFPSDIEQAFDKLFGKFDQGGDISKRMVIDLLRPLAYAEGAGLPWEAIWAPLASALSTSEYVDEDIRATLRRAAGFVVEGLENGRSVYRLYHQELAGYLCRGRISIVDQSSITKALIRSVHSKGADWPTADPYILTHLATHAAKGGELGTLLLDPLFLAIADRQRLIRVLPSVGDTEVVHAAFAYRLAYHHLADADVGTRLSQLQFAAHTNGGSPRAWLAHTSVCQPWEVAWANWHNDAPHWAIVVQRESRDPKRFFGSTLDHNTQYAVSAVLIARLGGIQIAISGSVDGTLHIWGLTDGGLLYPAAVLHDSAINQLAAIEIDGRLVILSAGDDGVLAIWDPERGKLQRFDETKGWPLRAVAAANVKGRWIGAFGGADGIIRTIDIESGRINPWRTFGDRTITSLGIYEIEGEDVIVSGNVDGLVQLWPLDGDRQGSTVSEHNGRVIASRVVILEGKKCIASVDTNGNVIIGRPDGRELASFKTGHHITERFGWLVATCIARIEDRFVLAAADYSGELRLIDLESQSLASRPLSREMGFTCLALPDGNDLTLVSGDNEGMLRIWSVGLDSQSSHATKTVGHVRSLTTGTLDGRRAVLAGTSDGKVHFLDMLDGSPLRHPLSAIDKFVTAITFVNFDGHPKVVTTGASDPSIRIWDLSDPQQVQVQVLGPFKGGFAIETISFDANPVIAFEGVNFEIDRWDLRRNTSIAPLMKGQSAHAYCIRSAKLGGELVLASSGADNIIRIWNFTDGGEHCPPMDARAQTAALAFAKWRHQNVLFSGGLDGKISIWNPADGQLLNQPFLAHTAGINSILAGTLNGETVGISGGADSTLIVWRPIGDILQRIYVGAWILSLKPAGAGHLVAGTAQGVVALSIPGLAFVDVSE
jgi:WD40 repeat protein